MFDGSFQLLHADVGNLEFLGKSAATQNVVSCLWPFYIEVYVYPMKSRKSISAKMEIVYREVEEKRKGQKERKYLI